MEISGGSVPYRPSHVLRQTPKVDRSFSSGMWKFCQSHLHSFPPGPFFLQSFSLPLSSLSLFYTCTQRKLFLCNFKEKKERKKMKNQNKNKGKERTGAPCLLCPPWAALVRWSREGLSLCAGSESTAGWRLVRWSGEGLSLCTRSESTAGRRRGVKSCSVSRHCAPCAACCCRRV